MQAMTSGWKDLETLIRIVTVAALLIVGVRFGTDFYQDVFTPNLTMFAILSVRQDVGWWTAGVTLTMISAAWFTWPRRTRNTL